MEPLFKLIELSIDAIVEPEKWVELTDVAASSYDAKCFSIFPYNIHSTAQNTFWLSRFFREDGRHIVDKFERGEDYGDREGFEVALRLPAQRLYPETTVFNVKTEAELPMSEFREYMRETEGIIARCPGRINSIGPWTDMALMHFSFPAANIPKKTLDDMAHFLPFLAKSINTYRVMEVLKRQFGASLTVINNLKFGAAIIDESGQILLANNYFDNVLHEKDGIGKLNDGRLHVARSASRAQFFLLLANACRPLSAISTNHSRSLTLARCSGNRPYIVRFHSIRDAYREVGITDGMSLVFLIDPEQNDSVSVEGIRAFDLLTEAEHEICRLVVDGYSTSDISDIRSVTINTVRSQIKSLLAKLNCRTRLDLIRIAITTHVPIENDAVTPSSRSTPITEN